MAAVISVHEKVLSLILARSWGDELSWVVTPLYAVISRPASAVHTVESTSFIVQTCVIVRPLIPVIVLELSLGFARQVYFRVASLMPLAFLILLVLPRLSLTCPSPVSSCPNFLRSLPNCHLASLQTITLHPATTIHIRRFFCKLAMIKWMKFVIIVSHNASKCEVCFRIFDRIFHGIDPT